MCNLVQCTDVHAVMHLRNVCCCSHVFETVDEDKAADSSKAAVEGQIKAVEQLLEELRKRRGSSS